MTMATVIRFPSRQERRLREVETEYSAIYIGRMKLVRQMIYAEYDAAFCALALYDEAMLAEDFFGACDLAVMAGRHRESARMLRARYRRELEAE